MDKLAEDYLKRASIRLRVLEVYTAEEALRAINYAKFVVEVVEKAYGVK